MTNYILENAIRVDASYVCNRANALFGARTARTGRPASHIARELCEATPWNVAGVDYTVGLPPMTTLTDWQLLSGPGITVNTTATPPYVRVDNTSNVVISGVDLSLHGGASLFFVNCPNPTVISSIFAGRNLAKLNGTAVIYADPYSPGLTVSYNTINGAGAGNGGTLVGAAGAGTITLTYNWLKHFPQHVLEILVQSAHYSVVYKYNLIERGGEQAGDHLNYLQFGANSNSFIRRC